MTETLQPRSDDKELLKQRLAALLLTDPAWNRNYTATLTAAQWLIDEAERVGWTLRIDG